MGLIDFVKGAGAKIFGSGQSEEEAEEKKAVALEDAVYKMNLEIQDLSITFDDGVATVRGTAISQEAREKVVLVVGNTDGVAQVDDQIVVEAEEPEARYYTVEKGDSLSLIAKAMYGDPMKYPLIFEANKPMLEDPDLIYPGQVLRIPALDE